MRCITDTSEIREVLEHDTMRHGYAPEHHSHLLLNYDVAKGYLPRYYSFDALGGIFCFQKEHLWRMVGEPILKKGESLAGMKKFLSSIFTESGAKKITFEDWGDEIRKELEHSLNSLGLKATKPFYTIYWPVCDLQILPENLEGKVNKGMRYARNRFSQNHLVEIKDPKNVPVKDLVDLVYDWIKKRGGADRVYPQEYVKIIEEGFPGCDVACAIYIDGVLRGLTAGWGIPNSKTYYFFIDVHDYSDEYLGEFVALDHFLEAKKKGFELLDFGGSDEGLLAFKKKFHPVFTYVTRNFSIMKAK